MDLRRTRKGLRVLFVVLESNLEYVIAVFLLAGFLLRCGLASIEPLNPDEAYFYLIGRLPTAWDTWRQSTTQVHPPFFFFAVRYWAMLGSSETLLRILPVIAGTLAAFVMYKWIYRLFDSRPAGLAALIFGAFSPFLVGLSIELRQYSMLLLFAFAALYFIEEQQYWVSAGFCSAAVLTHYSAVFLLPYFVLLLFIRHRLAHGWNWRALLRAGIPLLLPALIFATLYFTHIRTFSNREMTRAAREEWLASGYFDPTHDRLATFVPSRIYTLIETQYSLPIVSLRRGDRKLVWKVAALVIMLLAGVVLLRRRISRAAAVKLGLYGSAALIILLMLAGAAISGHYPLTATRHTSIFLVVTLPVVCLLVSQVCDGRAGATVILSFAILCGLLVYRGSIRQLLHPASRKTGMTDMINVLRSKRGNGEAVFTDYGSALVLHYYLQKWPITIDFIDEPPGYFHDYWWSGVHVISSSVVAWPSAESFFTQLDRLRGQRDLGPSLLVINAGMARPLEPGVDSNQQRPSQWLLRAPQNPELFRVSFEALPAVSQ